MPRSDFVQQSLQPDAGYASGRLRRVVVVAAPVKANVGRQRKGAFMFGNRHVPLIMGVMAIGIAIWLVLSFSGWWRYIPATLLLMFGWPSLKTAFFASDKEIEELTGRGAMSDETRKNFEDRI